MPNTYTSLTDQQLICKLYIEKMSIKDIAETVKRHEATIRNVLRRNNISLRKRKSSAKRKYTLDETVFDTITEESAYWIGFLMADGNVQRRTDSYAVFQLYVEREDTEILLKFKEFLKTNCPILESLDKRTNTEMRRVQICSDRLVKKLESYGVVQRKSLVAKIADELVHNRDFWRGVIDGDGTVGIFGKKKIPTCRLVGSGPICTQFVEYVSSLQIPTRVVPSPDENIFSVNFTQVTGIKVLYSLYNNSSVYLERKYFAYLNIIKEYGYKLSWKFNQKR